MQASYGVSRSSDTHAATLAAVDDCLRKLTEKPFAVMVFIGADHRPEAVASVLREKLPGVAAIGCTTDGEITSEGLNVDSVCVMVLGSARTTARATAVAPLSAGSLDAGRALAERLDSPRARALILLPDGLTGNGSEIIRGAQAVLGSDFVIAGGTAGDRGRFVKTWQIVNGEVLTDALVGMMIESDIPLELGFGVMAGWRPLGIGKKVTRAEGNTVYEIEGQTALEVYSSFLGDKASQLPAIGVEYPFALVDEAGRVDERGIAAGEEYILLRAPMGVNRDSGAVTFAAEIPQGATIKMTRGKTDDIIAAAREAASRAQARLSGKPEVVLFFSCMARKLVLGRRTDREIFAAQEVFGPSVPMVGFYTYGEIANCGQSHPTCRFHNETATFLAMREGSG